jgi:hypothetical protein
MVPVSVVVMVRGGHHEPRHESVPVSIAPRVAAFASTGDGSNELTLNPSRSSRSMCALVM